LLAIAICGSLFRIGLRIFRLKTFGLDDGFLLLALVALTGACVCMQQLGELLYLQIYASLHLIQLPKNVGELLRYHRLLQSASVLEWVAIFSAKISLLLFFRKLVDRIHRLKIFWTVILVLVSILGCICIPLGFLVCSDFSKDFLATCSPNQIVGRESIYTRASVSIDIVSDLLILSIPACLLWTVRIDFRRKAALASMLGLSVFMIIIAIIRVAAANLPGDVSDTSWLFFWQTMEAAVAVIMVVLTGFRSLFQQAASSSSKGSKTYGNPSGGVSLNYSQGARERYGKLGNLGNGMVASVRVGDDEELQDLKPRGVGIRVTRDISQESV